MQVKLFLLADYANRDAAGKENILGVFSTINARQFPHIHDAIYLVIRLQAEFGEIAEKRLLRIIFCDEDGGQLANMEAEFEVSQSEQGVRPEASFVIALRDVKLPRPGSYEFRLYIDRDQKESLPLLVRPVPDQEA